MKEKEERKIMLKTQEKERDGNRGREKIQAVREEREDDRKAKRVNNKKERENG